MSPPIPPNPTFQVHGGRSSKRGMNLASCAVATVFLLLIAAAIFVVYLFVFKPREPKIAVEAVRFPTFSVSNGTVNFTFFQYVSVTNPNRDQFTHYDSSLQLVYSGQPVGLVFIPAGTIDAGRTQHISAKFNVQSFPIPVAVRASASGAQIPSSVGGGGGMMAEVGPTMEIETRMKLVGRVKVLKIFTHRVVSGAMCGVVIEVSNGSVLGFHC